VPIKKSKFLLISITVKEGKMALVFKVLATIVAWILFVLGIIRVVGALMAHLAAQESWQPYGAFALTLAYLVLAVVVMKLRQIL
jgi:uncharacterized membrane protein YecN with MAPEG domain